ncbi:hypothetical protein GGF44_003637 [Coemansia sp. RSA 1694]|nr:hypothetical protein GGF38_003975 [Coemansia sp. RSA 25]KAJ2506913.1 hypothetical protein IWW47_001354 [Coemansia sp. RSA 2052]KAJ2634023.1 hypothetical protein GGF44_003637 [Coemansia sp. RSA 1694]
MSGNGRRSNTGQPSDAALAEFVGESNRRNQAQLDTLWQRIIATMSEASQNPSNALTLGQSIRRYTRPVRPLARLGSTRPSGHAPTPPEGWQFVPSAELFPATGSPPRSRRRLTRETRRHAPTSTALTALLANRPHLTQLISPQAAEWLEQQGNEISGEGQPDNAAQGFEPPIIRGPIIDFDDVDFDDVDDAAESGGSDADMTRWEESGFSSYEEWYAHNFLDVNTLGLLDEDDEERSPRAERRQPAATAPPTSEERGSGSVVVRQPWNTDISWTPYIYQQPAPNSRLGDLRETYQGIKHHTLPGTFREQSRLYSVHSSIIELPLNFLSTNDDYGSDSDSSSDPRNMLRNNSAPFITSKSSDVNVELCFEPDRHCVVEHIFVQSAPRPRCTELMVFASNRRCSLDDLGKYDGFTFADYEKLAHSFKRQPNHLPDLLPIAYFWLSFEDRYRQLQVLPRGISCKYLYVKMLRSDRSDENMGLRIFRVYGWSGARSFAEATIC